ncbi:hypothetical protein ACWEPM_25265 [Streptomyces sp. NPDC004244]
MGPTAQAAPLSVGGPECKAAGGAVEYDPGSGLWTCIGGRHDQEPID